MTRFRPTWRQLVAQGLCFAAFGVFIGYFTGSPSYQHLAPGSATVKISLVHAGERLQACRDRTQEELAELPPNMRAPQVCPRERSPVVIALSINGKEVLHDTIPPKGLHGDGRAAYYQRLTIPAGEVKVTVKMNDNIKLAGFAYTARHTTELKEAEVLVIRFNGNRDGFEFL